MKYTINEIATLLGVSVHTLRYYEKANIIKPETNTENGYRLYSVIDTRRFNLARLYRGMGFSMEQCTDLLSEKDAEEIIDLVNQQKEKLKQEVLFKLLCIDEMENYNAFLKTFKSYFNTINIIEVEEQIRIEFSDKEKITKDLKVIALRDQLIGLAPLARWVSRIPHETLKRTIGESNYNYGINMRLKVAIELGLDVNAYNIIEKGRYLVTIFEKDNCPNFEIETFKVIQDYLKKHQSISYGDGYSSCIQSKSLEGQFKNYHYFMVQLIDNK